jgi:malate synthase
MNAQVDIGIYSREQATPRLEVTGPTVERADEVLTPLALQLLASLHRRFDGRRLELLAARAARQSELDDGALPDFLAGTASLAGAQAEGNWRIAPVPPELLDRRVEIVGYPERQAVINCLNAPVQVYVADFEDSCSPTWGNIIRGQLNLLDAVRGTITYADRNNGRILRLLGRPTTLIVRPRGWHLVEKHVRFNGETVSAALFDFALYVANSADLLARRGTAPYFYLPKIESHLEARLWNDVFNTAEDALGLTRGTIKATVLIENVLASFEMDEILFELREHCVGLNCGRWDYLFSFIRKFRNWPDWVMPDRNLVTMERTFLRSYVDLLVKTCHHRGAYALGGVTAQLPLRDAAAHGAAMDFVRQDKIREARAGHDGTGIVHTSLAHTARAAFDSVFIRPDQINNLRPEVRVTPAELLQPPSGDITEAGLRGCIRVGVQYLEGWLRGTGRVVVDDLSEDAACAEICRAQLWQCIRYEARTTDGQTVTEERFDRLLTEELDRIHREIGASRLAEGVFPTAARLFASLVRQPAFEEFMTLSAYEHLT